MARPRAHAKFLLQWMNPMRPETAEVWEDPKLRGIAMGLLAVATKAMAGHNEGSATLGRTDLAWITGTGWRYGLKPVTHVCSVLGWKLEPRRSDGAGAQTWSPDSESARESHARTWVVTIPNFLRDQGFEPENACSSRSPHSQSHTHSQSHPGAQVGRKEGSSKGTQCPACRGVETFRGAKYCRPHGRERRRELERGRQQSEGLEAASRRNRHETESAAQDLQFPEAGQRSKTVGTRTEGMLQIGEVFRDKRQAIGLGDE